jgi:hypothetical protein
MHNFLLGHVYASRISDSAHQFFALVGHDDRPSSLRGRAAAHELAMAVVTKKINLPLCYL